MDIEKSVEGMCTCGDPKSLHVFDVPGFEGRGVCSDLDCGCLDFEEDAPAASAEPSVEEMWAAIRDNWSGSYPEVWKDGHGKWHATINAGSGPLIAHPCDTREAAIRDAYSRVPKTAGPEVETAETGQSEPCGFCTLGTRSGEYECSCASGTAASAKSEEQSAGMRLCGNCNKPFAAHNGSLHLCPYPDTRWNPSVPAVPAQGDGELLRVRAERDELRERMESFVAYLQDRINETGRNANPFFKDVEVDESLRDLGSWRDAIYAIQDETRTTYSPAPTEAP